MKKKEKEKKADCLIMNKYSLQSGKYTKGNKREYKAFQ